MTMTGGGGTADAGDGTLGANKHKSPKGPFLIGFQGEQSITTISGILMRTTAREY